MVRDGRRGVSLSVIDQGPGMTPETAAHSCIPYFSTKARSSGLGLSTVRAIVERVDGRLEIQSRPDVASSVTVTFPRLQERVDAA